jgi:hypothetical protein
VAGKIFRPDAGGLGAQAVLTLIHLSRIHKRSVIPFRDKPFPSPEETAYNTRFTLTDLEKLFWPTLYGRKSQPLERMSHHGF